MIGINENKVWQIDILYDCMSRYTRKKATNECSILGKIGTFVLHQYSSNDDVCCG